MNPCQYKGCPPGDLVAGQLSSDPEKALQFIPNPPLPSDTIQPSGASSATAVQPSNAPTASESANSMSGSAAAGGPAATRGREIAGIAAGALAAVVFVCLAVFWYLRHRHKKSRVRGSSSKPDEKRIAESPSNDQRASHFPMNERKQSQPPWP